jgi:hypothetical protein
MVSALGAAGLAVSAATATVVTREARARSFREDIVVMRTPRRRLG